MRVYPPGGLLGERTGSSRTSTAPKLLHRSGGENHVEEVLRTERSRPASSPTQNKRASIARLQGYSNSEVTRSARLIFPSCERLTTLEQLFWEVIHGGGRGWQFFKVLLHFLKPVKIETRENKKDSITIRTPYCVSVTPKEPLES